MRKEDVVGSLFSVITGKKLFEGSLRVDLPLLLILLFCVPAHLKYLLTVWP